MLYVPLAANDRRVLPGVEDDDDDADDAGADYDNDDDAGGDNGDSYDHGNDDGANAATTAVAIMVTTLGLLS